MDFAFWDDAFNERLTAHIDAQSARAAPEGAVSEARPPDLPNEPRVFVVLSCAPPRR